MPQLIRLRDAVHEMIKALVRDPDALVVSLIRGEWEDVLHVVTSERDIGSVIGKQGHTVRALRVLVQAAGRRVDRVVTLDVVSTYAEPLLEPFTQPAKLLPGTV